MWFRIRMAVICLAAGLLAGCATGIDIGKARNAEARGDTFSVELYHGYLDLAEFEYSEGDYVDSDHFSRQAVQSAAGRAPEPKDIGGRDMPPDYQGEAVASRARLMRALAKGGRTRWPREAARSQLMFDCWMQEQEEDFQITHIDACREAFMVSIARLEAAIEPRPAQLADAEPGDQVAMGAAGPDSTASGTAAARLVVYFAFDRYDLSPTAKRVIREAIGQARKLDAKRIDLAGHADRSGEEPYNQTLSMDRAQAVADAMKAAGFDKTIVSVAALGESVPAVPTPDGVRDHRNRRVEIEIAQ